MNWNKFYKIIVAAAVIVCCLCVYARFIEPKLLKVKYNDIKTNISVDVTQKLTVVQFSDTHISEYFSVEDLAKVVQKINSLNPDIVLFTGDLIDHYHNYLYLGNTDDISKVLAKINANIGKYSIYGNHDYGGGAEKVYRTIMSDSGFRLLINQTELLSDYNISVTGLDDALFGNIMLKSTLSQLNNSCYNIVLSHEPDIIDSVLDYNVDLFLSGHSHGGQVAIPVLSSLMLPSLGEKYVSGIYEFENARNTVLYVNKGIGTSQIPMRFMAVPEISVFTISVSE